MINFSKINWLIIVLIVIFFLAGVFFFQWWQVKGELKKQVEQNENLMKQMGELQKEINELKTTEEKATDETADWEIYRNEEYGYEVQYPKGWLVKDSAPFGKDHIRFEEPSDNNRTFDIRVYDNFGDLSLNQWFDSSITAHCSIEKRESVLVADVSGIEAIYTCGEFGTRGIFLPKKTQIYNIDFLLGGAEFLVNDDEGIYSQILSTFKFIEK